MKVPESQKLQDFQVYFQKKLAAIYMAVDPI